MGTHTHSHPKITSEALWQEVEQHERKSRFSKMQNMDELRTNKRRTKNQPSNIFWMRQVLQNCQLWSALPRTRSPFKRCECGKSKNLSKRGKEAPMCTPGTWPFLLYKYGSNEGKRSDVFVSSFKCGPATVWVTMTKISPIARSILYHLFVKCEKASLLLMASPLTGNSCFHHHPYITYGTDVLSCKCQDHLLQFKNGSATIVCTILPLWFEW